METLEYRTIDKTDWGDGPWQAEPDKRQWRDEATGLPCLIVRGPSGALCGYVGVSAATSLHGRDYDAVDVDCHGGLTFSNGCAHSDDPAEGVCHALGPGEPDDVWWFGFDCAHMGDLMPGFSRHPFPPSPHGAYRDLAYVTAEVTALAAQLAALSEVA